MRILVPGSAGQLAQEIIKQANALGHEVVAPDERTFNITDLSTVKKLIYDVGPDVVINCAAYNDVDKAETDWKTAYMVNAIGVKNLALACKDKDNLLVHYGTDFVFDGKAKTPYTIADVPSPISQYGRSKLLGEEMVLRHSERYFMIRTSWVFGAGNFSFARKIMQWAGKNKVIKMVDDQTSSPTYTVDLAAGTLRLIGTESYGLYQMTNTGQCSRYDWASHILKTIGWDGELQRAKSAEFNTPAQRPEYSTLDNFPLQETIGELLPSWQDATERFIKTTS